MSFRYRLCPDEGQEQMMAVHCGQARLIWNLALEQMNIAYAMGLRCDQKQWGHELAELRNEPGLEWLRDGSSTVQQQALRQLRQAWKNFWGDPAHFGRPKFRAKHRTGDGFVVRDVNTNKLNKKWSQVHVPKVGWVKFRTDRRHLAEHGMAHVTRDKAGRWHVSFAAPQPPVGHVDGWEERSVGVDRGASKGNTVATSDREMLAIPVPSQEEENKLKRAQRKLARQKPGSNRRETTRKQIAQTSRSSRSAPQRLGREDQFVSCLELRTDRFRELAHRTDDEIRFGNCRTARTRSRSQISAQQNDR